MKIHPNRAIAALLLSASLLGQSKAPTGPAISKTPAAPNRGTVNPATQPAPKFTLTFEVGLIMKSGDVRKLPRQEFYILNRDISQLGDVSQINSAYDVQAIVTAVVKGLELPFPDFFCNRPDMDPSVPKMCERLKSSKVAAVTTDFNSIGKVSLPAGVYYILGHGVILQNQAVWNVKVNLTGNQSVILDNMNASDLRQINAQ